MAAGDPRMWGMLLLGLLVGLVPLLAAAALVRYLSQSRDNGHQGASPGAQAAASAEGVGREVCLGENGTADSGGAMDNPTESRLTSTCSASASRRSTATRPWPMSSATAANWRTS